MPVVDESSRKVVNTSVCSEISTSTPGISLELESLLNEVHADIAAWNIAHGLEPDAFPTLPSRNMNVSIDEFLCPDCDTFIGSAGCDRHSLKQTGLPL